MVMIHMILMGLATILAILVGPSIAVWITRKIDQERADKARKMEIFRTLMRTRGMPIHWDHVGALNLVEVEFSDHENVIERWKEYLAHLNERPPEEQADLATFGKKRDTLLTALMDVIAKALDIKITQLGACRELAPSKQESTTYEPSLVCKLLSLGCRPLIPDRLLDILQGNYVPSGWSADEDEQRWLRRGLLNALSGKGSIPIQVREKDDPPLLRQK